LYVTDTFVIKDDATYKMWYTHGLTSLSLTDIASRIGALLTQHIIDDIGAQNLNALLNDIAGLNATDVFNGNRLRHIIRWNSLEHHQP
jgi:hypothetical protein